MKARFCHAKDLEGSRDDLHPFKRKDSIKGVGAREY